MHGRPGGPLGTVRLALIRTGGIGEKSTWLLHRMKTDAAGRTQEALTPAEAVATVPASDVRTTRSPRPMLATGATPALARSAARRWGAWAEVKWDGIRALGVWDGTALRLWARSGTEITARYPELTAGDPGFGPEPVVLDGEIVALDAQGRPSFTRLQNRMHLTKPREIEREAQRTPVRWFPFDALGRGDSDLDDLPLRERRALLEQVCGSTIPQIVLPPVFDDVDDALAASAQFGLEGVVVKNPDSRYRRGARSDQWLKVKLTRMQEVVVGGIRPGRGGRTGAIGSLLVGIPSADGLQYAGRVGTGFGEAALARLEGMLQPLRTDENPFVGVPAADASDALWVRPEVVGEVEFGELTPAGILRHSRWRGLRPDKSPSDVVVEK
ncbi:hypothetical protein GCM10025738_06260 [Microbacterium fluvii]